MRVRAIRIEGYGALGGRSFENLPPGVVPIVGPNEAGKSTFRALLADLIYGFDPANRESHPFVPWDGADTGVEADFAREDGRGFSVRRRLRSTALGDRTDGKKERIGNNPVEEARHVPRALFRSIYDLDREDMNFPRDSWDAVKDRLLGAAGEKRIRPAREVAEELEGKADSLWRPDRRGKPRAKEIADRLKDLGVSLRDAKERDRSMRALEKEAEELAARDEALGRKRVEIRARAEKARFWADLRGKLERRRARIDDAGDIGPYADVPEDPLARLAELDDRVREGEEALREKGAERESLEKAAGAVASGDDRILAAEDRIGAAVRGAALLAQFREDRKSRLREIEENAGALREKARDLIAEPERAEELPVLSPAELESRIRAWRRAESGRSGLESAALLLERVPVPSAMSIVLSVFIGIAAAIAGILIPSPGRLAAFGAAAVAGFVAVFLWSRRGADARANRRAAEEAARREEALREARTEEENRLAAIRDYLADWGVLDHRLHDPGETLLWDVKELLDRRETGRRLERSRREIDGRIEERERAILGPARECGVEEDDPERAAVLLAARLEKAKERGRVGKEAEERLPALRAEITTREARLEELREERERIAETLRGLGGGEEKAGALALAERREAARDARRIEEDLSDAGHDPDALEMNLAAELAAGAVFTPEETVRLEAEADRIEDERHTAGKRLAETAAEKEHLSGEPGAGEIEGEREALREEEEELKRDRDRLALLAAIVRESDRRYRREHAPDIVKRASAYFARITGGRYDELELDSDGSDGLRLFSREKGEWVDAKPPLSRGTLDQIYLALRLALVDHIEGEGEPLPLLLDEVFLHWDGERAGRGFTLLEEIAARRQVFLFSCRPESLPESIAGGAIRLAAPGEGGR
ncbi:MAG: AAA family ATPase [Candidatus Eisenbacteria bacterium]|nr:AAA family ATPase [Candidatus Eisenbacteria bacterium]